MWDWVWDLVWYGIWNEIGYGIWYGIENACREWPSTLLVLCNSMFLPVACFVWLRARSVRLIGTNRGGASGRGQDSKIMLCNGVLEHYESH